MIEVEYHRGLYLPGPDLWLDPRDSKPVAFVSHAHADHFARHQRVLCSDATGTLIRARYHLPEDRLDTHPFNTPVELNGHRLRLLPAGHIRGSAMLHVTRLKDGASLLYTGDFKTRKSRTAEMVVFQQADLLILETTFALPRFVLPPPLEIEAAILGFVRTAFQDGDVPILLGYSLGKAQEALALLHENGIPTLLDPKVAEMSEACRATGLHNLPDSGILQSSILDLQSPIPPGTAIIAPPHVVRSKPISDIPNRRLAMLTGWALDPGAAFRYRVDEAIPLSDHADHPGLLECIQRVRPKRILTVHGYAREFAAELRQKGFDAWSAAGHDQLELAIGSNSATPASPGRLAGRTSASARHSRPICPLADFTDLCRLVGETQSRLEKSALIAPYLKSLESDDELAIAATWMAARALPDEPLVLSPATIRRAVLRIPGIREERFREIADARHDPARTARLALQEIPLSAGALDLPGLLGFFRRLAAAPSIARIELLTARLHTLHPAESETLIRLLTANLRIGLEADMLDEALTAAFDAAPDKLRRARALTGDPGETAVLARHGRLHLASPRPFIPIPLKRHQLHKLGTRVALYAPDLKASRPIPRDLARLIAALAADFIIEVELPGTSTAVADDLFDGGGRVPSVDFQLPLTAFDLQWLDGDSLLDLPPDGRLRKLRALDLAPVLIPAAS